MEVNLKKAAALAAAIAASPLKLEHSFSVDIYGDAPTPEQMDTLKGNLQEQIAVALALTNAVFVIRELIGKANEARVNTLLSARALLDKQLSVLNSIPVRKQGTSLVALARQMEALQSAEVKVFGQRAPNLDLETESIVSPLLSELRKKKRAIDDELQAVNFTTTIKLPEAVVEVLTILDLV